MSSGNDLMPKTGPELSEAVAWLRAKIEGDKAAALAATPGPWEFEDDDELFTVHDGEHGDLVGQPVAFTRHLAGPNGVHMALHDPRDVIADCAAKLAILDEHVPYECSDPEGLRCKVCASGDAYPSGAAIHKPWPCPTVVSLSRAYRHRDGWRQHWGMRARAS